MPIIGNITPARGRGTRKVEIVSATGPASDVSVGAAAGADVAISISPELATKEYLGIMSISGLTTNIGCGNIAITATAVTLHAINPTAAAITVAAGSVTVNVLVIGY